MWRTASARLLVGSVFHVSEEEGEGHNILIIMEIKSYEHSLGAEGAHHTDAFLPGYTANQESDISGVPTESSLIQRCNHVCDAGIPSYSDITPAHVL